METLVGAVVGGVLSLAGGYFALRAELRHRVRERVLLELVPHTLARLTAARARAGADDELDAEERQALRDATGSLVAALSLGSFMERDLADQLQQVIPDFEPGLISEDATWDEVSDAAARQLVPTLDLDAAEDIIRGVRTHYIKVASRTWRERVKARVATVKARRLRRED